MISLSIITITNGDLGPLERTAASFHQNKNVEWIVISSKDTYPQHLRKPELFIGNECNGIFSALNLGLHRSRGNLVVFMNAGDEFYELDTIKKVLDSWHVEKWHWAVGQTYLQNRNGKSWRYPKTNSLQFFFGTNSFCHQAIYCETEILRMLGGFNEVYLGADWALTLKLSKQMLPTLLNFPVAIYEHGGASTRQSYLQECIQKHSARKYYELSFKPNILDLFFQFLFTCISRLIQKSKG